MVNKQAIKWLKDYRKTTDFTMPQYEEALDMAIKALQEQADRNEFYNWDAPIRHKADGEYILKSEAIRVASGYCHLANIAKELEKLPSVDIPPEHDGCKDCVYQDNPQDAMPCRECKHNYMDKWKARPSVEPYKGMTNGEVIKTIFDVDEIQVTENTVIVRVKGSFCAKMQFLLDWWNSPYEPQESEEV